MRKIVLASCFLVNFIFPLISFAEDIKWSGVLYVKGTGATNCGKPRISNEAWDRCEEWAKKSIKGNEKPVIKDIELYNIAIENDKGPSWNPKLNCNFRASVKCGYRLEKISTVEKLKLAKGNRLKGEDAESCDEPAPEEVVQDNCEVGAESKKPAVVKAQPVVQPPITVNVVAAVAPPKPITVSVSKMEIERALAALNKDSGTKQTEAAPKIKLKWSGKLSVKGIGITNCSNSRITSEAWEICEAWAEKKKGKKGAVKPEVKDLELSNITVATGKPIGNDPNPSCSFQANVKCGYSTVPYIVEHSTNPAKGKGESGAKESKKHNLDNLFGDGLRWSELIAIEGTGISNCSKSRINNEAWERCETWTVQQKKKQSSGGLHPVLKNVELYNIASENEKGTSWAPKQSCSFHATMKCGYKME